MPTMQLLVGDIAWHLAMPIWALRRRTRGGCVDSIDAAVRLRADAVRGFERCFSMWPNSARKNFRWMMEVSNGPGRNSSIVVGDSAISCAMRLAFHRGDTSRF
jgi:hypothetical protein